jgi:membrane-anchored glycerophosphoryl diester phosphodiesterase (GDPDase)
VYSFLNLIIPAVLPPSPKISISDFSFQNITGINHINDYSLGSLLTIPASLIKIIIYPFLFIGLVFYDIGLEIAWVFNSIYAIINIFPPFIQGLIVALLPITLILLFIHSLKILESGIE